MSQTVTIRCDFCGKIKGEVRNFFDQLWSTLITEKADSSSEGIDKKKYDICVPCTHKILKLIEGKRE